jgi:hypothetical protein
VRAAWKLTAGMGVAVVIIGYFLKRCR